MEEIKKKLEELKKEVFYAKHADLSIIDKIDVKVKELEKAIKNHGDIGDVMHRFPDNPEIWKWWKEQRFQKEQGEQEYTMIYEFDLPKILKAFTEHLLNGA